MIRFQFPVGIMSKRTLAAAFALLLVAACQESEEDCFARITSDFKNAIEFGNEEGFPDYALAAAESDLAAYVIFIDDDRDICDYVTAGPYLERKSN
jgi:hypothetical protein